jgi:hypothetical protein
MSLFLNLLGHLDPARTTTHLGVSFFDYKSLEKRNEKGRRQSKRQERKWTWTHSLSSNSVVDMNLALGEGLIFRNVSWSECTSSCIECDLWKTWMPMVVVVGVVFIAPNHIVAIGQGCWRWVHRTVQCAIGQVLCAVRCATTLGFEASRPLETLSSCGTGQSGATPDSPVPSDFYALTLSRHCSSCQSRPLVSESRCSAD